MKWAGEPDQVVPLFQRVREPLLDWDFLNQYSGRSPQTDTHLGAEEPWIPGAQWTQVSTRSQGRKAIWFTGKEAEKNGQ